MVGVRDGLGDVAVTLDGAAAGAEDGGAEAMGTSMGSGETGSAEHALTKNASAISPRRTADLRH